MEACGSQKDSGAKQTRTWEAVATDLDVVLQAELQDPAATPRAAVTPAKAQKASCKLLQVIPAVIHGTSFGRARTPAGNFSHCLSAAGERLLALADMTAPAAARGAKAQKRGASTETLAAAGA